MARGLMPARAVGAVVLLFALTTAIAPLGSSSSNGVWDARERGCYCHDALPSVNVGFTVAGLPGRYVANATYTVQLNVTLTDVGVKANGSQGGFYIEASAGLFSAPPGWEDFLQFRGSQSTHTPNGTRMRHWQVNWTAPNQEGLVVTFYVFVNTVNGDRSDGFSQDHWTMRTVTLGVGDLPQIKGPPPASPPVAVEVYVLAPLAAGAGAVSLYFFFSARRGKSPPPGQGPKVD